jgi:hypothetical protein
MLVAAMSSRNCCVNADVGDATSFRFAFSRLPPSELWAVYPRSWFVETVNGESSMASSWLAEVTEAAGAAV